MIKQYPYSIGLEQYPPPRLYQRQQRHRFFGLLILSSLPVQQVVFVQRGELRLQGLAEVHLAQPQQAGEEQLYTLLEGKPVAGYRHIAGPLGVKGFVFRLVRPIYGVTAFKFHVFHCGLTLAV